MLNYIYAVYRTMNLLQCNNVHLYIAIASDNHLQLYDLYYISLLYQYKSHFYIPNFITTLV